MENTNKFQGFLSNLKDYSVAFCRWVILGLIIGCICGGLGYMFSFSITAVTSLREDYNWIIYLLPVGGLLSVGIYKLCKVTQVGTNHVFESVRSEEEIPVLLAPAVFLGSIITHLFGGSAGKEGAALQLGGSVATLLSKILKLGEKTRHILTMCGMAAFFSAVFGTPIGAVVFAVEVVSVGKLSLAAFFPGIIASITAYGISTYLGVHPEKFSLTALPQFNLNSLWKVIVIAVISAFVSVLFCKAMHLSHKFFKRYIKNDFLRILIGGFLIIGLTLIVGNQDYNGGGFSIINRIFENGEFRYEAFLLKIIFTAITAAVGFKGGEIVPTFFIGATLGASIATLIGLDPAFGAAIGMAALFCGVTNCPLATIILAVELFDGKGIIFIATAAIISFFLSGYSSLYTGQKLVFSKTNEDIIDKNGE